MKRAGALIAAFALVALAWGPPAFAGNAWTTYHGDMARSGVDSSEPSLDPIKVAWTASLDGAAVYGQPVVADGRVIVATEDDDVYALDAHDGRVLWSDKLGAPLRNVSSNTGCGDIDPLGITSTPVIDTARDTVFVVAEVSNSGALPVRHDLAGFNLYSGQRVLSVDADPAGVSSTDLKWLQQRASLGLGGGRVYVGYGGLAGDCGSYHGWVVGVDEGAARPTVQFDTTPTADGGAVWNGGGGPSVDASGNVYITTGNTTNGTSAAYSESVVKLPAGLGPRPLASFQDHLATGDADLGTGDALLLPNGTLFTVGKTDTGYLLYQSNLAQVHAISGTVCGSAPDGGATWDASTDSVYVPCSGGGIQQVSLGSYSTGWHSGSVNGSPILVDGELWAAGYGGHQLEELDPMHGDSVQPAINLPGAALPTFATPSAADGLLLIGTGAGVVALAGPSGPPPPAPPPPGPTTGYRLIASDGGVFSFGTAPFEGSLGGHPLNLPIVGAANVPGSPGYWMVAADGGVFSFGGAHFYGSMGGTRLNRPVVGMAATSDGKGYWLVASDGGVFSFGDARFRGSTGALPLKAPIVAMAENGSTGGYWLFGSDGGVFSFGAPFYGSMGATQLTQPVVGASTPGRGGGYWMVARDGGLFAFRAPFYGSTGGVPLNAPIVGMAVDPQSGGYWLAASDGGVFTFNATFEGSMGGVPLARPVVAATGP